MTGLGWVLLFATIGGTYYACRYTPRIEPPIGYGVAIRLAAAFGNTGRLLTFVNVVFMGVLCATGHVAEAQGYLLMALWSAAIYVFADWLTKACSRR